MGHAVNKILKDMIVKSRQLKGLDAAYIPGWDCHGLPIENAIEKKFGRNLPRDEMQAKSRAFATEQIGIQMGDFKRLGVLGDWDNPYKTMAFQRGQRDPRLQARDRARLRLPRPEAGVLVLRLRLVAGGVRDRVRGQEVADAGRGVPRRRQRQGCRRLRRARRRQGHLRRHLDHDRLDHPGQPGAEPQPGASSTRWWTRPRAD